MEQHTPVEVKERAPLQAKINTLTTELVKVKTVLEQTRELLKSAEQDNIKLKVSLEEALIKKGPLHRAVANVVEVFGNMKFQSPIVKKEG